MKYSLVVMMAYWAGVQARCPLDAPAPLSFVLEYAVWRGWPQALVYTPYLEKGCQWLNMRLSKCMGVNGIATSFNLTEQPRVRTRIGVLVLMPRLSGNASVDIMQLLKKLHALEMNTASYDWLLSVRSEDDYNQMSAILNVTSLRFDQTMVVGYFRPSRGRNSQAIDICDNNFVYKRNEYEDIRNSRRHYFYNGDINCDPNKDTCKSVYERSYYRASARFRNLTRNKVYKRDGRNLSLFQSGIIYYNTSRTFDMMNVSRFALKQQFKRWSKSARLQFGAAGVHVVQYFKVRHNSTLYAYYLGFWNLAQSMSGLESPYPVEARNFLGEELIVGRCNITAADGAPSLDDEGPSAPALLDDVLHFLKTKLNSTPATRYFGKLGFRTYEGTWTGLLGALMDESVDLALEPVTAHPARHQNMDFIFPIAETMCNIYIRQQETSTVRDIFTAPFSGRLVACVVGVALLAAAAVVLISRLSPTSRVRRMEYAEALIWSTGILCQQGGAWTPSAPAASVVLIASLLFAVVTYNAYAAFITSVLSVRVASLDTVAAVLDSPGFKIGYIRNGADQMYLMSTKDALLNEFYIRGYTDAENLVSSAEEGLARAAKQDYAFFAGQRAARSTLRNLSQARGRCAVRELPVHSTRAQLAFPLPHKSPYARPTLISLLQLHNTGALARLQADLVPGMPECAPPAGFASARATDVRSALILIIVGLIAALMIGLAEYSWKNRKDLHNILLVFWRRVLSLVKYDDCI